MQGDDIITKALKQIDRIEANQIALMERLDTLIAALADDTEECSVSLDGFISRERDESQPL